VDVEILQQLRFVPMDIENWSSIVVICCVRQGPRKTTQRIGMEKKTLVATKAQSEDFHFGPSLLCQRPYQHEHGGSNDDVEK